MYTYKTTQWLPVQLDKAWDFFSSPANLEIITPPDLAFRVVTSPLPLKIFNGLKINYTVKPLFGIRVYWETEISGVDEMNSFTDKQIKGPYKKWEHTHIFKPMGNGVMMTDIINYSLPYWLFGTVIHRLLVRRRIHSIFEFRREKLNSIFKI